jgi:hypothetical protein
LSGNDTGNTCAFSSSPCRTIGQAYNQSKAGGEIICLGPIGGTGTIVIQKSLRIDCEASPPNVQIYTGPNDIVTLRRLTITSLMPGSDTSLYYQGVYFAYGGTLILDHVHASGRSAVEFTPNQPSRLIISDSTFTASGSGTTGAGILIKPTGSGSARVSLERVDVGGNIFGVAFDGSGSTAGVNATIKDSMISGNTQDGIVATTTAGHAPIGIFVSGSASVNNAYGIRSIGPNVTVRVKNSEVTGNGTGLAASGGGALLSLGGNAVQANGAKGAFTGSLALE